MSDSDASDQSERRATTARNLRIDAATADALAALNGAGIEAVLLKGPSIARWLYDGTRGYVDTDVWVRPADARETERVLAMLGFKKRQDEGGIPDWWREHGSDWFRPADGVHLDLHRTLPGLGVDADSAWRSLSQRTETMDVARYPARVLSPPARALHIALHSAQHGRGWLKVLADLERALEVVEEPVWLEARELAEELAALDAFGTGLRLLPAGAALADRLDVPVNRSVKVALHADTPPPIALGFDQIAQARSTWARARIVARKLVPPPGFMRHWYPAAAEGSRVQLMVAYLYRPVWLLRNALRGWRAWRRARIGLREAQAEEERAADSLTGEPATPAD